MNGWTRLVALFALCCAAGCTEIGTQQITEEETTCEDQPVLATNPTTGVCEWINDCDRPADWTPCNDTSTPCTGLDEVTCTSTPGCEPDYTDGSGVPDSDPIEGGGMPFYDPYLGCLAVGCESLDEASCVADPECQAVYAATPCAAPMPGEEPTCEDAFVACEDHVPPTTCDALYDPTTCDATPGCSWLSGDEEVPCFCDPDQDTCECGGLIAPGHCATDDTPPPTTSCVDLYDPTTCDADPACQWLWQSSDPMPCECSPDDPDCVCAVPEPWGVCEPIPAPTSCYDLYDIESCTADAGCEWTGPTDGAVPPPCACDPDADPECTCDDSGDRIAAYCIPTTTPPTSCVDLYDVYSCTSLEGCEWVDEATEPMPCECPADDPDCGCTAPAPGGFCQVRETPATCSSYADLYSCGADADCEWVEGAGAAPMPCECPADDPDCTTCSPEEDPCWGAWIDETGSCRAPNDGAYPDSCCATLGVCQEATAEPAPACADLYDPSTCDAADGCHWDDTAGGSDQDGLWLPGACLEDAAP